MVIVVFGPSFERRIKKIKNQSLKIKLKKQIVKVINNPKIGKPMKHTRKGTRELYVVPFRLSYTYLKDENKIILLDFYHKDKQ